MSGFRESFRVGWDALEAGKEKKEAVVLVPGIVSSGLESWSTTEEAAPLFRKRLWGTSTMLRAMIGNKKQWIKAMTLDPDTGLDCVGQKVRAAQGLDAASSFGFGYWIWNVIIQNLAVIGYDYNDLYLAAYDWRLSYYNLEVRDRYFSRLKSHIEFNKHILGKKTVLVSHSMGGLVVQYFMKWAEAPDFGNGGPQWCEDHLSAWVNIAGTQLGVPKSVAAFKSHGTDTVEMPPAGAYILEKFFSRQERTDLFRSWAGSASMLVKGGSAVWGDENGAPDDPVDKNLSYAYMYYFRKPGTQDDALSAQTVSPNMTQDEAHLYLLESSSSAFQKMLQTNYSYGIERDYAQIEKNDNDHRKWTNPLETRLPNAPSMSIYCLYGVGKDTERAYWYQRGPMGRQEVPMEGASQCLEDEYGPSYCLCYFLSRSCADLPLGHTSWIDTTINLDSNIPKVRNGVMIEGEGDGTVSLISLGAMCVEGWKRKLYNPAGIKVVTREIKHQPIGFDPRGGVSTGDHIDILGSTELNEAILNVASGNGHLVKDRLVSRIKEYASRIKWEL
ncbi:Lecithin:cholesterol acyltransferase [Atractiella rhizophila]|nr:Lecithin:cholesterol acyltransferase [Atractiella rhizophila]